MEVEKRENITSAPTEEKAIPKLDISMTSSTSSERFENCNATSVRHRPSSTITPTFEQTITNRGSSLLVENTTTNTQSTDPEKFPEVKPPVVDQVDLAKPSPAAVDEKPVVVEESIVTQSVNNSTMSAPPGVNRQQVNITTTNRNPSVSFYISAVSIYVYIPDICSFSVIAPINIT